MSDVWKQMVALAQAEVAATVMSLPSPLRTKARALPVTYERWPSAALVEDGVEPDSLGLFVGGEFAEGDHAVMPAQIILFLESIWDMVEGSQEDFRAEIRTTLLHELGHYLGLDEDELLDRGLE